jgi:GTP-binding protein EngB required for normal cell division
VNLADVIGRWVGRVEIVLAGAEDDLLAGEDALAAGDALRARAAARRVLDRVPGSPIGLALLADACAAADLDAELALTLEELAHRAPSRAEVWMRLGRARHATGAPPEETRAALLRALAVAEAGSESRVEALIALADVDLAEHDGARAELWLARIVRADPAVTVRRAEARLLRGDSAGARALLEPIAWAPTDGRAALALGRARAELGDAAAFGPLLRAFVLDVPGASEALSSALARIPNDAQVRTRVRSIVDAKGEQSLARWHAAFALAEGSRDAARLALRAALRSGEPGAASALLDASVEDHDAEGLVEALRPLPPDDPLVRDGHALLSAQALDAERAAEALDALAAVTHPRAIGWAQALSKARVNDWIPRPAEPAHWSAVLARLDVHAHTLGDRTAAEAIARLAADRASPVLLAVVGEFNAGKSTFINALVGAAVAPTGILPTTAVLHHLRWAPDSMAVAKILVAAPGEPRERIVAPADLRATLARLDPKSVERVEIRMPIPSLARVEILDTPGFNADVAEHEPVARSALDEADMAVWLVDATQAIKQSERRVLEDAQRRKLPVQVLVNKADRLTRDEIARVLGTVNEGLAEMGIVSWMPPCAFSSKQALAGRLGDADALRNSGWEEVRAVMEDGIVAHSDGLKEGALRRRARLVVRRLVEGYRARATDEERRDAERADEARLAAQAAARVDSEFDGLGAALARALEQPAQRWSTELSMVFVGRDSADDSPAGDDSMLVRYRVDSAVAHLVPPLTGEILSLAPSALRPRIQAGPLKAIVRAAVRSAASATPVGPGGANRLVAAVCRSSMAALVEQLLALTVTAQGPTTSSGALRELEGFAEALERD